MAEQISGDYREACTKAGEPVIETTAKSYVSPKASRSVDWVSETAGRAGPIHAPHLQCSRGANDARPTISNIVLFVRTPTSSRSAPTSASS